jgi:hypothetical protein
MGQGRRRQRRRLNADPGTVSDRDGSLRDMALLGARTGKVRTHREADASGMQRDEDGFAQATRRPALVNLHTSAGTGNGMGTS